MMAVLACTYHDPNGRLFEPITKAVPVLMRFFDKVTIQASPKAYQPTITFLKEQGVLVAPREEKPPRPAFLPPVGFYRRTAVAFALQEGADYILLCDFDRAAHWANYYPDELKAVVQKLPEKDFWVIGRTERAFYSHPPSMVQTEQIINLVFAQMSGFEWDVVAATRGMSAEVGRFLVETSRDDSFGNDASWPLLVLKNGRFATDYIATEGMEYETADAFPQEVAAAGGVAAWVAQRDANPQQWLHRLKAAVVEVTSIVAQSER